jgi:PAS domain S-box-containing protein
MERIPVLRMGPLLLITIQVDMHDKLALQLQDDVTQRIAEDGATGVLIDISSLEIVDSFIGRMLSKSHNPRILIADDREENRYVLSRVLRSAGYDCVEAATGTKALELADTQPDLIILDVNLPDMSGFEVCGKIKRAPRTASIPILQISAAFVSTEDRVRALEAGADGYLTHPIDRMVLVATVRALLRLKIAESRASNAAQQWQATFDSLSEGLAILDADNRLVRWNTSFESVCGKDFKAVAGKDPIAYLSRFDGEDNSIHLQERVSGEFVIDGRTLHVSINNIEAEGEGGEKLLVVSDITDRRLAEYAMRTAEKLAATGKLASAIAHEINNPLEAVTNLLFLARSTQNVDDIQSFLAKASTEIDRISRITKQTLAFHRETQRPVSIDMGELLADVVALYERPGAAKQVRLLFDAQPAPRVSGYPGELTQVFANLIRNAIDAAPANSEVFVRVKAIQNGGYAGILVHDRGPGIPKALRDKIFDPFFTTKGLKGSGLGLWVSRRIIAKHQGVIRFRSCECAGKSGTSFGVFLPANRMVQELPASA